MVILNRDIFSVITSTKLQHSIIQFTHFEMSFTTTNTQFPVQISKVIVFFFPQQNANQSDSSNRPSVMYLKPI